MDEMGSRFKCVIDDEGLIRQIKNGAEKLQEGLPFEIDNCIAAYCDTYGHAFTLLAENYLEVDYVCIPPMTMDDAFLGIENATIHTIGGVNSLPRLNGPIIVGPALRKNIKDTIRIVSDDEDQIVLK